MREILVVSGKGGTGKTSITASLAALQKNSVLADCDVDASDLHLVLTPNIRQTTNFISGHEAVIRPDDCTGCLKCQKACRFGAIKQDGQGSVYIDTIACEGCGVCVWTCPVRAVDFVDGIRGQWFFSETRFGPMIHAKLNAGAENSGKLVSEVRFNAKMTAQQSGIETVLIDGPPGIGCPVIAAMTGVDYVLIVTEPTLSGMHDMERVAELARHFAAKVFLCVNKCDINPEIAAKIEENAKRDGIPVIGKIPYDSSFTRAQIMKKTVTELEENPARDAVEKMWNELNKAMEGESN